MFLSFPVFTLINTKEKKNTLNTHGLQHFNINNYLSEPYVQINILDKPIFYVSTSF